MSRGSTRNAPATTRERVERALDGLETSREEPRDGMTCVVVAAELLHTVLARLKARAGFQALTLVTCVDHLHGKRPEPRFEVVHQLHSLVHADRVRVKTRVGADDPRVASCVDLWPGAGYMEREAFDMFGVVFEGNPDLRRLLMPEEYEHHPLRRDFPHQGIEPDLLYREWDRKRRAEWNSGSPDEGQAR